MVYAWWIVIVFIFPLVGCAVNATCKLALTCIKTAGFLQQKNLYVYYIHVIVVVVVKRLTLFFCLLIFFVTRYFFL